MFVLTLSISTRLSSRDRIFIPLCFMFLSPFLLIAAPRGGLDGGYLAPPLGELAAPISREAQTERASAPRFVRRCRRDEASTSSALRAPSPQGEGKARELKEREKGAVHLKLGILRPYDILAGRGRQRGLYRTNERTNERTNVTPCRHVCQPLPISLHNRKILC